MDKVIAHVRDLLQDHLVFHDNVQMDHFITMMHGGTPYGDYKQALRELNKRFHGLRSNAIEVDLAKNDLDRFRTQAEGTELNRWDRREAHLKALQKVSELEDAEQVRKHMLREFARFYAQAATLKRVLGDINGNLEQLQWDQWHYEINRRAALDLLVDGCVGKAVIEMVASLPKDKRVDLFQLPTDREDAKAWLQDRGNQPDLVVDSDLLLSTKQTETLVLQLEGEE